MRSNKDFPNITSISDVSITSTSQNEKQHLYYVARRWCRLFPLHLLLKMRSNGVDWNIKISGSWFPLHLLLKMRSNAQAQAIAPEEIRFPLHLLLKMRSNLSRASKRIFLFHPVSITSTSQNEKQRLMDEIPKDPEEFPLHLLLKMRSNRRLTKPLNNKTFKPAFRGSHFKVPFQPLPCQHHYLRKLLKLSHCDTFSVCAGLFFIL